MSSLYIYPLAPYIEKESFLTDVYIELLEDRRWYTGEYFQEKRKKGATRKKKKRLYLIRIIYNELGTTPFRALADDCPFCCCWCYIKKKKCAYDLLPCVFAQRWRQVSQAPRIIFTILSFFFLWRFPPFSLSPLDRPINAINFPDRDYLFFFLEFNKKKKKKKMFHIDRGKNYDP